MILHSHNIYTYSWLLWKGETIVNKLNISLANRVDIFVTGIQ